MPFANGLMRQLRPSHLTKRMLCLLFIALFSFTAFVVAVDTPAPSNPEVMKDDGWLLLHVFEVLGLTAFIMAYGHARLTWGPSEANRFFPIVVLYSFLFEDINITLSEQYSYNHNAWLFIHNTMMVIPLGWCVIVYILISMLRSDLAGRNWHAEDGVRGRRKPSAITRLTPTQKGLVAGVLALSIDLGIDATAFAYGMWFWKDGYWFGVPLMNFVGWFVVVFLFVSLWFRLKAKGWPPRKEFAMSFGLIGLALLLQYLLYGFIMAFFFSVGVF